ncbi:MAG: sigma-70 family RNA polymerase sigma factor [Odoribacteraceae bacterium]|jgi:RNA polymerase sigma-70 factor (ECF subfamily)|nr:sigma-70 family RNA polymerase sigma factor [Odoribacteraceae bacterium]
MYHQDEEICRLLRQQDKRGLEKLFTVYYRPLVTWADTFMDDMSEAEDLVQEFFVKLWERGMTRNLLAGTLKSYLFTSVKNASFNAIKRRDPLRRAGNAARVDRAWVEYDDLNERLLQELESEIEKLPPRSKEIVKAIHVEGMHYKEVAERYAISVATVKTLLVGALKRLREKSDTITGRLLLFFYKISSRLRDFLPR